MDALVLLSGGIDSTTALGQAKADGYTVSAISFRYGSLHQNREMASAMRIAKWYGVPHEIVQLPTDIFKGSGSALMGEIAMPDGEYQDAFAPEGPSPTVVPFRNAVLISMATAFAQSNGMNILYAGMHASDHTKWAYPDCSPEFLGAMSNAIYVGTMHQVRLVFPFVWMTKTDVITRAALHSVPADLTYSCYRGGEYHCGECPTCVERLKAFAEAGFVDPAKYSIDVSGYFNGLDEWPVFF